MEQLLDLALILLPTTTGLLLMGALWLLIRRRTQRSGISADKLTHLRKEVVFVAAFIVVTFAVFQLVFLRMNWNLEAYLLAGSISVLLIASLVLRKSELSKAFLAMTVLLFLYSARMPFVEFWESRGASPALQRALSLGVAISCGILLVWAVMISVRGIAHLFEDKTHRM